MKERTQTIAVILLQLIFYKYLEKNLKRQSEKNVYIPVEQRRHLLFYVKELARASSTLPLYIFVIILPCPLAKKTERGDIFTHSAVHRGLWSQSIFYFYFYFFLNKAIYVTMSCGNYFENSLLRFPEDLFPFYHFYFAFKKWISLKT